MMLRMLVALLAACWYGQIAVAQSEFIGGTPPNTLSEAERKAGWTLLFDGQSFEGWRNYKQDGVSDGWKIEDGAMVRSGQRAGDLITKEQYDNFELLLEYKISEGGNSGVMFHVTEDNPQPWHSGPEIQIQDNIAGRDGQKAGWLYQLYEPGKARDDRADEAGRVDATRPPGEWNQLYVRVAKQQSAVNMNGYPYYQFVIGSDDWNQRVAKSKFAQFEDFAKAGKGHVCLQDHGNLVAFRNIKIRKIEPTGAVGNPVDGELAVEPVLAFPDLELTGWEPVDVRGKVRELRPIIITHAGDGSNRLFIGTQDGVVHVFNGKADAKSTTVFLDIAEKVADWTNAGANEEGFLGLAFHPKYEENGRFFVYYTHVPGQKSIISEFQVSKSDPNRADPASERVLLTIDQPFKNHNGGSIEFGPDGYLYIGLGDGGSAYDPHRNGQNIETLLGSILRIDVDGIADRKEYRIPQDNPFVGKDGADEIYAYGFRNPWRISFDRKTGQLWAAEVGQDLWEEVVIVNKGGNYGWNGREALHPFGDWQTKGSDPIPPVWEYDHQVGKSITGGAVYRGKSVPELEGHYIYADYVTGKLWALKVDDSGKAVANLAIPASVLPVTTFGEDEAGEIYFGVGNPTGKGIYKFRPTGQKAASR